MGLEKNISKLPKKAVEEGIKRTRKKKKKKEEEEEEEEAED